MNLKILLNFRHLKLKIKTRKINVVLISLEKRNAVEIIIIYEIYNYKYIINHYF